MWWQCLRREYTVFNKQKFATFAIKFCRHLLAPQRRPHVSRLKPAEELLAGEASEVSEAFALAARSLAAAMFFLRQVKPSGRLGLCQAAPPKSSQMLVCFVYLRGSKTTKLDQIRHLCM